MPQLKLFGTQHCHLCDEAKAIVRAADIEFEYVDIAADDKLLMQYGTRIPVLQQSGSCVALDWPFDQTEIEQWLAVAQ